MPTQTELTESTVRESVPGTATGKIVLLSRLSDDDDASRWRFSRCLREGIAGDRPVESVFIDVGAFENSLFPWFEKSNAPRTVGDLRAVLSRPVVRQRIAALNVRYLVNFSGSTDHETGIPGMICGGGYGGAGCLGLSVWDQTTEFNVVVWDLMAGEETTAISATTSGRSVTPALIVPFPFLADTAGDSCSAVVEQLRHRISSLPPVGASGQ